MVTRSASPGLLGLEPAGRRLLLAAARLPDEAIALLANSERWTRSAAGRAAGLFAVITAAYVVGAELAWHHYSSGLAFGYPPSGVDVAALLLIARRRWPVVIAAIVVSEVGVDLQHHLALGVALASALANVVEPVTGASFVRWFCAGRRPDLATRLGLGRFLLGAAVLGPVAGGLIGATVSWASKGGWWPGLVLQWWAGDGIAVLVIGGTVLLWAQRRALVASRWLELVLVVLLTAGLSVVAFRFGDLATLPFLPILAWAAFRLRDLGVVLTGAVFAAVANYMTAAGYGEFAHLGLPPPASVAVLQAYIALVVLVGWVLAQEVAGRTSAVQDRDSARLERAMAEARREAAELGAMLADAATVNSVGDQVSAAVRARLDAAHVVISLLAADGRRFEPLAGGDAAAQVAVMSREATIDSDAPGPRVVRERTAVYVADLKALDEGIGSVAALPLLTEVGALGYLGVWWAGPHEATALEREYLQSMAETTSRALERARLREAERREHARVESLADLTRLLAAAPTPEAIGEVVAERVRAAVGGADALRLGVVSQDGRRLMWVTTAGYAGQISEPCPDLPMDVPTAATDAAGTGRPVIIRTPAEYEQRYPGPDTPAVIAHGSSWLTWPLRVGTAPVGAISLTWKHPQQFEQGQLSFVAAVADLVAQAQVRARAYADEHALAAVLQRAIMPTTVAVIPGLQIGASYRQAGTTGQVGGDWYDALGLPGHRAYLAVGDVVGHGLAAAEDMTQLRNAGRTLAIAGYQPASILEELARVTDWATSGKFATAAVAIIEPDVSVITYATAGHPPILIRRAKTGTVETPPAAEGPALCLPGDHDLPQYTQGQTGFDVGDIMLMYTDGLIERRGEDLEEGIARVAERLQAWQPGAPLGSFCDELIASLGTEPQLDDMCVLAVARLGPDRAQGEVF
ncbi:MAG TPA: SpoIIE family protein phosphatase [Streptosporangiaceae bacterium]|nr:SpoIIE family protein phosphatase [Streptosporangiaceae bacterium]